MAIGKGIVASNLGQISKVLKDKKTAWLVKLGDVNDLASGIIEMTENKQLREELGTNARREVARKYIWEQNIKKIINNLN